jgi:hypothetical protein
VTPKELTLTVGETGQITATVTPSNATNKKVNWSSSDETIATVDENGAVTAVAAGTATITATSAADSSKKDSCVVTVEARRIHTVAELKAKYDADTKIGIWVGVTSPNGDEKTATISNVTVKKLFGGGNGTEADPYLIGTFEHLKALEKLPVVSDRTYYVKLTNNIVVEENKYVNIPCYDLVMDLDNHTIFCDTNGLCIGFGSSPYTREANYTIKNGCFWQSRIRALRFRRISSLSLTISLCEHDLMSGAICN